MYDNCMKSCQILRRKRVMICGRTRRARMQSRFRTWSLIRPWSCKTALRKWHMRRSVGGCRRRQCAVRAVDCMCMCCSVEAVQFLLVGLVNPFLN